MSSHSLQERRGPPKALTVDKRRRRTCRICIEDHKLDGAMQGVAWYVVHRAEVRIVVYHVGGGHSPVVTRHDT